MLGRTTLLPVVLLMATFASAKPLTAARSLKARGDETDTSNAYDTTPADAKFVRPFTNNWVLDSSWKGDEFFNGDWKFETDDDPTHGRVNYVNQTYAQDNGLAWADGSKFGMAADHSRKVEKGERGRDSIRISTNKTWKDAVYIVDVAHMPTGCGTWPAFWTVGEGAEWPAAGEIDIIEGCHEDTKNYISVHTANGANCTVPPHRANTPGWAFGGQERTNLCDGSGGCNVGHKKDDSFGSGLNDVGGGWYVTRRDARGVSMWFYPRTDGDKIPDALLNPTDKLDETVLGHKIADFPATEEYCGNMDDLLMAQRLIFNLTFCGGWGTAKWDGGSCKKKHEMSCSAFVDENPDAFKEAFWLVNGVWVYTPGE